MKVLHLTMHENSGAGRAAVRLHEGLLTAGVASSILVTDRTGNIPYVSNPGGWRKAYRKLQPLIVNPILERAIGTHGNSFSVNVTPAFIKKSIDQSQSDILHLHWIGWEFLRPESLANFNIPLVWTLHDMWPFTGGCHYAGSCTGYVQSCGTCPQLPAQRSNDASRWLWQRKSKAWESLNLTIVAPSHWLADCARASSLFQDQRIEVISHGLNTQVFKPIPKLLAREILNLPPNKQLILFGALGVTSDPRKGFSLLQDALKHLGQSRDTDSLEIVIFGNFRGSSLPELPFKCHSLGRLQDDVTLAIAYSAADVMVVPSTEEAFGQTAAESLACGTPVVAFQATGLKDVVSHQLSGYLARPYEVKDLSIGINWILENLDRYHQLSKYARQQALEKFSLDLQAKRHIDLYLELSHS